MRRLVSVMLVFLIALPMVTVFTPQVSATENVIFQDDFESYEVGEFPSSGGWEIVYNGAGDQYQVISSAHAVSGIKSLQLMGTYGWSVVVEKDFSSSSNKIGWEVSVMSTDQSGGAYFGFHNRDADYWGRSYCVVSLHEGYITVMDQNLRPFTPNVWYKIKAVIDKTTRLFDVWIDGQLAATNLLEDHDPNEINAFQLSVSWHSIFHYYDDVKVFEGSGTPPQSGLVGYWNFDEGSGTMAGDSSGNGNTGTLYNGPVWVDGKYGKALSFDGSSTYVSVEASSSLDVTSQVTVEAWAYARAYVDNVGDNPHIVSRTYLSGGAIHILNIYGGTHKVGFGVNPFPDQQPSTADLPLNVWTHIAMTYDGAYVRFYVNGELDSSYAQSGPIQTTSNWLAFGCMPTARYGGPGTWAFFNGMIDEVRIYNRALSQQEIQTDLNGYLGDWNHYHDYAEIVNTLLYLNGTYPNNVDVFSIGKSWLNQDIYCIKLTNESSTNPKPKLLFVGYHHAREPISAELPLYFAVEAATNFGTNETITRMLNYSEIYIVPALNVDGFEAVSLNDWQRKNSHPYDEDGDGLLDEDPPNDEDGDGYIEALWQIQGEDWTFIRWEGVDDDSDGLLNEDWIGGVDLNRNYGYQWNATCDSGSPYTWAEDYRGPAPFSEPETQAIRDLALTHDFKYAISFHSGAENIVYPWGYTNQPSPDDQVFREVAANLSALVGAPYEQSGAWYTTSGVWDDWMYGSRNALAFTCEIFGNDSAWQYEPGPEPDTYWERGVFQFFNPDPANIETVIQRWLPTFTYITNRAITEAYDVATTNVTPLKTVVGQGYSTQVDVNVTNKGDFTETFNVTAYANTTSIGSQNVTLSSGASTTLTFTWNTSDFVKGNYTIKAYAWHVSGETHTIDNTLIDGIVAVTIPSDVDGDFDVDLYDIVAICAAYGSNPPGPPYTPNKDINDDGIINIYDVVLACTHYGQKYP